ncbi:hypothetical protein ACFLZC_00370 [Patescibacteria group bacterium]
MAKITGIEKVLIRAIITTVILLILTFTTCNKVIEEGGGISEIAVSVGKEVKDIQKRINEE